MTIAEKTYFRKDINGLRTLAVLGVVLFHLQVASFSGGFLGVDVFFTISGYLITASILREVNAGKFSFKSFYYRRTRRLAPALVFTVAGTLIAAIVLFPPSSLIQTAKASLAAAFSVSNIFFWLDAGYFSADAMTKPLLHTWSLGLEEQFYLLWPLLIVLAARFRMMLPGLVIVLVGGVLVSQLAVVDWPNAAFFLLPFRAFEFALGGLVVYTEKYRFASRLANEVLKVLSLVAIVASFVLFNAKTPFPGLNALVPCAATALLIQVGPTRIMGLLLENPVSTFIGRVSYSIYLVHWPIIVFTVYTVFRDLTGGEKAVLFVATMVFGSLLYYAVEQRFRFYDFFAQRRKIYACGGVFATISLVAIGIWAGNGWAWRSPAYLSADFVDQQKDRRFTEIHRLCGARSWATCWDIVPTDRKRVLIMGDSEGSDGLNMVMPSLSQEYLILSDTPGCPPFTEHSTVLNGPIPDRTACIAINRERLRPAYLAKFDVIVVSALWAWYKPEHLRELLDFLKKNVPRAKVIVFGPYFVLKTPCADYMQRNRTVDCFQDDNVQHKFLYESELKKTVADFGYMYVSKRELLCSTDETCRVFTDDPHPIPMTWDVMHLSYEFGLMIGALAKDDIKRYVFSP